MIKIRKGKRSDSEYIADFQIGMAKETEQIELDRGVLVKGIHSVFDNPEKGNYFVAVSGEKVVASMLITPEWSDWRNGYVYWIQSVYVMPDYRKQGVFKTMYMHIKNIVQKDKTIRGLRLYVDKNNVNARKVYEALGMNGEHYRLFEWMK